MDYQKRLYIIINNISHRRREIIFFKRALCFCESMDSCHGCKTVKPLEFFIFGIYKLDVGYLGSVNIIYIHFCCKEIIWLENIDT